MSKPWTREEEIIVFNLYCKIPFKSSSKNHPDVIRIANLIGRTPSAVNMKIGNFGSFDENLRKLGITGLVNSSKLDRAIWDEFNGNWEELAFQSEQLIAQFQNSTVESLCSDTDIPLGYDRVITTKQRVNHRFFRECVLASYEGACCITGLSVPELLVSSHIKPWKVSDESEKTNPRNGLCLNALHDKAFDRGFITIDKDFCIVVSDAVTDIYDGKTVETFFKSYSGKRIRLPDKFIPAQQFIEYHNDVIFEGWK